MPTVGQFHKLWSELHRQASASPQLDVERWTLDVGRFLEKFTRRIPCGGCQGHWRKIITDLPPDLSSRQAYFRWTVSAHNAVNRLIGKPVVTLRAARKRWGFDIRAGRSVNLKSTI